jgi:small multidrug resistance pump
MALRSPLGPGEYWACLAALCYAGTNTLLRAAIDPAHRPDPMLAAIVRLLPVSMFAWALVAARRDRQPAGSPRFIGWRRLLPLILSGASSYFLGNSAYQTALNAGGINVTVPAAQSASMWGGVLLGALLLGERFRPTIVGAGLLVMLGLLLINFSPGLRLQAEWQSAVWYGAIAGVSYALSNVLMRAAYRRGVSQYVGLGINTLSGLAFLIPAAWARGGAALLAATPTQALWALLAAGLLNAGALLSLSRALTLTTSSRVNIVNTATIAISALLAVALFDEPMTPAIGLGIVLIIGGILAAQRSLAPARAEST